MSLDKDRSGRLDRILKVQGQKRRIEEWRLQTLRTERGELDRQDTEIFRSLDTDQALHGLFVEAKVKTLRRNEVERDRNTRRQGEAERRIRTARRLEKGVEKARDEARGAELRDDEAAALLASLDVFLSRDRSSLE